MGENSAFARVLTFGLVVCLTGMVVAGSGLVVGTAAAGNATTVGSCTDIEAPGVYNLDQNITRSTAGSCLNITANDVVLDGQGYTLQGPGDSQTGPVGINVTADRNVTVQNVNVTEWTQNVYIESLDGGTVTNVTAPRAVSERFTDAQEAGVRVNGSEDVRLSDVHASDSELFGVFVTESSNVTVVDSTLTGNDLRNLYFQNVSGGTVRGVNASAATVEDSFGMYLNTSSDLTVEDSTVLSNGDTGVLFESVEDSVVRNVTVRENGDYGMEVDQRRGYTRVDDESDNNLLVNNTVVDNGWHGIFVTDSSNNTVRSNTVSGHSRVGIGVQTADTASGIGFSAPTTVDNVTVEDNTLDNNDEGILVDGDSRAKFDDVVGAVYDITLRDNNVTNSEEYGVVLSSSTNVTLRDNEVTGSEENLVIEEYERVGPSHSLSHYRHDIDTSNTVDGRPIHYYRNVSDLTVGAATNAGFVGLVDASNVTVRNLALSNNGHGVLAVNATNTTVRNLTTDTQRRGVEFMQTDNSSVVESDIANNGRQSVALYYADDNMVRDNSFRQTTGGDSEILLGAQSSNNRVHNNSVRFAPGERGDTGILIGGSGTNDNRITDNELVGVRLELQSIYRTVVRGNDVRDTDTSGIDDAGIDTRLLNNTVHNTTNAGIESGTGAVVRKNTVTEVGDSADGIAASGDDSLVTNNTLRDVSGIAFDVTGSNVTVANNTVDTATSGVVTATFAGDVTVEDNTFLTITGTRDDEAGVYDETEEGSGTMVRDNRFVNNSHALRLGGYGTVTNNSVESSDVSIWVDSEAAGIYDITDNTVDNSSRWAYYNVYDFSSGSSGWPGSVTNLSLPNATVSFTDREAALVGTTQPACDPSGRVNQGVFLNTSNTSANAWLDLTVHYDRVVHSGVDESSLTLYYLDDGTWTELSTTRDTTAGTVSANITQFGTVGLFADGTPTCPAPASFQVSVNSTTSPVVAGNTLNATVTVENTGVQTGTQTVTLATDGTQRDATAVTVDGGQSKTVTLSWATGAGGAGSYTATVESENDTDTTAVRVDATPTPKLEVSLDSTNAPVTEGETLEVTGTVENVGTAESDQDLILWIDGTNVDDDSMWLDSGESETTTLDWDTASGDAGTHNVTLSTKNDTESTDVTVQPVGGASPANFSVTVDSTNSPVTEGETLTVDATVENTGDQQGTQDVNLSVNGTERDSTSVTLDSDNNTSVSLNWSTGSGDAGSYSPTVESENGSDSTSVTVDAPSSAANFDVTVDSTNLPVAEGETLTVDATVENTGDQQGTQDVTLTVDGTDRDSQEVTLDSGNTASVSLDWTTGSGDGGSYTATVESKNGTDSTGVTVDAPSSAANFNVSVDSTNSPVAEGETLTIDATVDNTGTSNQTQIVTLSTDGTQRDSIEISLNSSEARSVALNWTTSDGDDASYTATVETANDSDTASVNVTAASDSDDDDDTTSGGGGGGGASAPDDEDEIDADPAVEETSAIEASSVDFETAETVGGVTFDEEATGSVEVEEYDEPPAAVDEAVSEVVADELATEDGASDAESTTEDGTDAGGGGGTDPDVVTVADVSPTDPDVGESSATVEFEVDREEFDDPDDAVVFHEADDGWRDVETTVEQTDGETLIVAGQVESFSLFAVAEVESDESTQTDASTGEETTDDGDTSEPADDTGDDDSGGVGVVFIGILVVAGGIGAVYVLRQRSAT